HRRFVKWGDFIEADIRDIDRLRAAFRTHRPDGVVHLAALIEVGTSYEKTADFYENKVGGAINLIKASQEAGIGAFVFSSTCAVYGMPQTPRLSEDHPLMPINPYGRTKWMVEHVLADMKAHQNFPATSLRYFNAAGAAHGDGIGEHHQPETHALPLAILAALGRRSGFGILGDDYDTRDGTCVRDYIHVNDLADAHVKSVGRLLEGHGGDIFNLGTGDGATVRELIETVIDIAGSNSKLELEIKPRRPGDPPQLLANNTHARETLGWTPKMAFRDTVESAWRWHRDVQPSLFDEEA
ncbi:MAG: UDP-glucose 4-epimerase GalE, partial [Pseudomonadota bacterium]